MGRSNTKRRRLNQRLMKYEDRYPGFLGYDQQIWLPKRHAREKRRLLRRAIRTKDFGHLRFPYH